MHLFNHKVSENPSIWHTSGRGGGARISMFEVLRTVSKHKNLYEI